MAILNYQKAFRTIGGLTPGPPGTFAPVNILDTGMVGGVPSRSSGAALLDVVDQPPNVGQIWSIQSISFNFYVALLNPPGVAPFLGPFAQLGKLYGGMIKGALPTASGVQYGLNVGFVPYASRPIPPSPLVALLWDGAVDSAPPSWDQASSSDLPTLALNGTLQLDTPVEYSTDTPISVGLWLSPGIFSSNVAIFIYNATYNISYTLDTAY
jgi:hypothetical protein